MQVKNRSHLRVPKAFKLFATRINVLWDNDYCGHIDSYGETSYSESKIRMSDKQGQLILSEDKILDTFYHEKMHMILSTMHRYDLSGDEGFVDTLGKLIRQSDETAIYNSTPNTKGTTRKP